MRRLLLLSRTLMFTGRAKIAVLLLSISVASCVQPLLARKKQKETLPSSATDRKRALHALNRLTFGPRPGDVQRVMAIGVDRWIDLQLHPERIDDSALNSHLQPFRTLRMSTKELAENFPDGQEINQVRNGKRPMPSDAGAAHGLPGADRAAARKERTPARGSEEFCSGAIQIVLV